MLNQSFGNWETGLNTFLGCVGEEGGGEKHFEELAHMIVKVWQVSNLQGRPRETLKLESKGSWLENSLLFFVPLRPSTDWMEPTYIIEGNLLYSRSIDLNVNLI